jgi:hypothetical protein
MTSFDAVAIGLVQKLRAGGFESVFEKLSTEALKCGNETLRYCNACPSPVMIEGWSDFASFLSTAEQPHAVGIDLSWHNGYEPNTEPAIEVSIYGHFPEFEGGPSTIYEHIDNNKNGTHWQGAFDDVENALQVVGLSSVHQLLEDTKDKLSLSFRIGEWWRYARFVEATAIGLDANASHLKIPVILQTHDIGPHQDNAYIWVRDTSSGDTILNSSHRS